MLDKKKVVFMTINSYIYIYKFRGGSYLVGPMIQTSNSEYQYHGDVIFLYPDLITCLFCQFEHGKMIKGKLAHLQSLDWQEGVPIPVVTTPTYLNKASLQYTYEPSGSLQISRSPLLRDPYEMRYVYVGQSGVSDAAGEGLFVKTYIKQGTLVSLFNGVRQHKISGQLDIKNWSDYR